ncbi:MAG: adaptor protein MecA [Lachnospiraceae bacterium]|nr:adaptor protein MecA [Lachnospiraceae bacterium]
MKIEKINDNQIRCTLNKFDLASRQIKLSELAYGTDKAKRLFKDMMQQASAEFGFEAEDIPLMIEAIPISADCIVLMITKVEDPEELDTRFSRFAPAEEEETDDFPSSDLGSALKAAAKFFDMPVEDITEATPAKESSGFIPLPETIKEKIELPKKEATAKHNIPGISTPITTIFSFTSLDDVINLAGAVRGGYNGTNSLYKSEKEDKYYLVISQDSLSQEKFAVLCNLLSEYGRLERYNYASKYFLEEQYTKIIGKRALQKLATVTIL